MKKNLNESKNSSASVQSQLSQQQEKQEATQLSTLTMNELESVQGGSDYSAGKFTFYGGWIYGCWHWRDLDVCGQDDGDA